LKQFSGKKTTLKIEKSLDSHENKTVCHISLQIN